MNISTYSSRALAKQAEALTKNFWTIPSATMPPLSKSRRCGPVM